MIRHSLAVGFRGLVCAAAFSFMAFHARADSPPPQPPLELTADNLARVIDPLMTNWIDKRKGPGAVVVVVKHDAMVFAKGYGFSDVEARTPFTADATLVRPGSISKLFTGIAVMQLVDAGKLDLDRDVNGYIDFTIPVPEGGVPVTLRRLLTHRAGFEEHVKGLFSNSREPAPLGSWLPKNLPRRLFPNGDVEAYSNYGVALAGYIVERVSGEPFAAYVQQHILDPLGMRHSTFRQPLSDDLAPLMAKAYRASDKPPLTSFETIIMAPAGALSATGTDMGRFLRALMNGGELDGARILSKARLDEMMMAPTDATPAGYLGLVFFGGKVAGYDSIGHAGATMAFFSDLKFFPGQDIGVFVSRDGIGAINPLADIPPDPANVIARRFLPKLPDAGGARTTALPDNADLAGIYHLSRRAESTWLRMSDLLSERAVKVDGAGNLTVFPAIWPFVAGRRFRRVEQNLYEGPANAHLAFVEAGAESYFVQPSVRLQRVPWFLDVQWIVPAFLLSTVVALLTLICWPIAALWRRWRKRPWGKDRGDRRKFLAVRLVLLADVAVVVAIGVFFTMPATVYNEALDPLMLVFYALAWLGVLGAIPTVWSAVRFWRNRVGGRWSRIHHSLIAASSAMMAWVFVVFRVAGTTLNY